MSKVSTINWNSCFQPVTVRDSSVPYSRSRPRCPILNRKGHVPFDNIYSNGSNTAHVDEDEPLTEHNIEIIVEQKIMWNNKYLQNRVLTGDRDFEAATTITAGENVRSFADQYNGETGEFVVESGKTTLSAP